MVIEKVTLKDVFTPGGQPSLTYVSRDHLKLEAALLRALNQGLAVNVVTGPTKSGKTVLCRKVLSDTHPYVGVEGGQIRSEIDFWNHIANHANIASTVSQSRPATVTDGTQGNASVNIGVAKFGAGGSSSTTDQTSSTASYVNVTPLACLQYLKDSKKSLLVDDFHYIPKDIQKAIIQALKAPVYDGLSVILLAAPPTGLLTRLR